MNAPPLPSQPRTTKANRPLDPVRLQFGRRLRELRMRSGRTQEQLAAGLGIALKNYQRLESGRHNPTLDTLGRLATVLGVSIGEFFVQADSRAAEQPVPLPRGWRWLRGDRGGLEVFGLQPSAGAHAAAQPPAVLGRAHDGRRHPAGEFLLQVQGNSMAPRIADGDWVLLQRPVQTPWLGKVVLVQVDAEPGLGQWWLKRLALVEALADGGLRVRLDSTAPGYAPLWRQGLTDAELGVVAELVAVLGPAAGADPPVPLPSS